MALSTSLFSSSSFKIPTWEKYDVFLSFRSEDTGDFASHLSTALNRQNIKTLCVYHDDVPEKEEILAPQSFKAIEESKLSIIIFSENYASSTWCLEELVHVLKCKEKMGHVVVPIFYNLDPPDVQNERGNYGAAFALHEERLKHRMDKLQQWRNALTEAADLSGWTWKHGSKPKLVEVIIQDIRRILNRTLLSVDLRDLVGIKKRIEEIIKLLCIGLDDIRVVGIWGVGGIGKTTLAAAVYRHLSSQFEDCYFIADVREESNKSGLVSLERKLSTEKFKEEDTSAGSSAIVKETQKRKTVLLVLDDVDDTDQFELLARKHYNWFGKGSRIIVTTRNAQLLTNIKADGVYIVGELNYNEAMELFHLTAFGNDFSTTDYLEESKRIVEYSKGIPLTIKTLGSYLHSKSKYEWKSAISKLTEVPGTEIPEVLKISFDSLDYSEKEAFLDIACFLKGEGREFVEQLLGDTIIDNLIDKSLVTIKHNKQLWMHDLVQEMGREIVRRESIADPGKRSRLWNYKDLYYVFTYETGTAAIEGISLETSEVNEEIELTPAVFQKMRNLRLLKIINYDDNTKKWNVHLPHGLQYLPSSLKYLHWDGYPLKCLPPSFTAENLVGLVITNSNINDLPWHGAQHLKRLKLLDLSHSKYLTKISDFDDQAPNLECIRLQFCTSLVRVPSSFQHFDKLRTLDLRGCSSIKEFPMLPRNIRHLDLSWTSIEQVPSSIEHLINLETLNMEVCKNLEFLPGSISSLNSLTKLNISGCPKLKYSPELPLYLEHVNAKNTSLVTWSKARIALTQGQDDSSFQQSSGRFDFFNCLKLDQNARTNIMNEGQLTFLKRAASSSKDKEGRMFEFWYPGHEIPKWFSYQSKGSSIRVELHPNWCSTNFLGFALCVMTHFKDCHIDDDFVFCIQFDLAMDSWPHELAELLTFNWNNNLVGSDHPIIVDSEYVFLFNYRNNSFTGKYDNSTAVSFKFYSNKSGCNVKKCGVHPLYTEDVEKIIFDVTQYAGRLLEIEDVKTGFEEASLIHEPEASGSLNVHDARTKKEEDKEKRFHDITEDVSESSVTEQEVQDDYTSDFDDGILSYGPESSGSLDVHDVDTKKEGGDLNPTYFCRCLMFLSPVVDLFRHVLGRQSGSDEDPHSEEQLHAPDKVLHSIMMELGEHNKRISQHLQTVLPRSHGSFDSPEATSTSAAAPPHSTATEKQLHETREEIMEGLCSQIMWVRNQNSEILQNLQTLVPTTPDDQIVGLLPKLTLSSSAPNVSDLFKDVIAVDEHVEVPEELIHSLRSHLTELQDHNQKILQFLRIAMSNPPTTTNRVSVELISKDAGSSPSFAIIPEDLKICDVFISFHFDDTWHTFASHLYKALCEKKIKTYFDGRLERGDEISPAHLKAIQEAKISIVILSENYASSVWCLEELSHILQCRDQNRHILVPVYYHIDPSDVRHQRGSYKVAFAAHEKRFKDKENKVKQWQSALMFAADLSGWDLSVTRPESKLVEAIVENILEKKSLISASDYEDKGLVGTEKRIKQIESLLEMGLLDVHIVGIYGVGGIGKTTLARIIFNRFAPQFDTRCFLENVKAETKRHGLFHLQERLFSELLKEKNVYRISTFAKERLCHLKALVVLDDVDDVEQFEYLAGNRDCFGLGSRIIITTRNEQVLQHIEVDGTYKVEKLIFDEAVQLLSSKAFGGFSIPRNYMELSRRVINHAKGIPLAIEDLGRRLSSKSTEEWESELSSQEKSSQFDKVQKDASL